MSELKDYIDLSLKNDYEELSVLSETSVNKLTLYKHKESGNKLVLIKSAYRNDEVFRKLKARNTGGYTPIIYEVCSGEDYLYVLEEFVDGTPLTELLSGEQEISEKAVYKYLIDLCGALQIIQTEVT